MAFAVKVTIILVTSVDITLKFEAKYYVLFLLWFLFLSVTDYCHLLSKRLVCSPRNVFFGTIQSLAERGSASHLYSSHQ